MSKRIQPPLPGEVGRMRPRSWWELRFVYQPPRRRSVLTLGHSVERVKFPALLFAVAYDRHKNFYELFVAAVSGRRPIESLADALMRDDFRVPLLANTQSDGGLICLGSGERVAQRDPVRAFWMTTFEETGSALRMRLASGPYITLLKWLNLIMEDL